MEHDSVWQKYKSVVHVEIHHDLSRCAAEIASVSCFSGAWIPGTAPEHAPLTRSVHLKTPFLPSSQPPSPLSPVHCYRHQASEVPTNPRATWTPCSLHLPSHPTTPLWLWKTHEIFSSSVPEGETTRWDTDTGAKSSKRSKLLATNRKGWRQWSLHFTGRGQNVSHSLLQQDKPAPDTRDRSCGTSLAPTTRVNRWNHQSWPALHGAWDSAMAECLFDKYACRHPQLVCPRTASLWPWEKWPCPLPGASEGQVWVTSPLSSPSFLPLLRSSSACLCTGTIAKASFTVLNSTFKKLS